MSNIFVLSLHRSATQSVSDLLARAGATVCHYPAGHGLDDLQARCDGRELDHDFIVDQLEPVFRTYRAVSDVPLPGLYDALYRRYPDAAYLAVTRTPADWVASVRRHLGARPFEVFERVQYWRYLQDRPRTLQSVSDEALLAMHAEHHVALRRTFPAGRFRLFELGSATLGEDICRFVGLPPLRIQNLDSMRNLYLMQEAGLIPKD